jgi:hypothetical protein
VLVAAIVVAAALAAVAIAAQTGSGNAGVRRMGQASTALTPANMAALRDPRTTLPGVPQAAASFGALAPAAGTAHRVGINAVAWEQTGRTCWIGQSAGGCFDALDQPVEWSIKDPDFEGSGTPPSVFGMAVDQVRTVTVTLLNGQTVTTRPVRNFFVAVLPATAVLNDVDAITAEMADGSVYTSPTTLGHD